MKEEREHVKLLERRKEVVRMRGNFNLTTNFGNQR
jgi:hypothetical protein